MEQLEWPLVLKLFQFTFVEQCRNVIHKPIEPCIDIDPIVIALHSTKHWQCEILWTCQSPYQSNHFSIELSVILLSSHCRKQANYSIYSLSARLSFRRETVPEDHPHPPFVDLSLAARSCCIKLPVLVCVWGTCKKQCEGTGFTNTQTGLPKH